MRASHTLLWLVAIVGCVSTSDVIQHTDESMSLNKACTGPAGCPEDFVCGTDGEQAGQCVIEGCPSRGVGGAHGCPEDTFCYVFDGDQGHYCTNICETDAECKTLNPALVCRERSSTESLGIMICVLGAT